MFYALSRPKTQHPRFRDEFAFEIAQQGIPSFIITHERTAIDEPIANSCLQWNTPLPAAFPGNGTCIRNRLTNRFGLHRYGTIAGKPVSPVFEFGTKRLVHQQADETTAVDKQVALHNLS